MPEVSGARGSVSEPVGADDATAGLSAALVAELRANPIGEVLVRMAERLASPEVSDPSGVVSSLPGLSDEARLAVVTLAYRVEAQVQSLQTRLAADLADRPILALRSAAGPEGWLIGKLHVDPGKARSDMRLGRALQSELPSTRQALAAGEINRDHARAIHASVAAFPEQATSWHRAEGERLLLALSHLRDPRVVRRAGRTVLEEIDPDVYDAVLQRRVEQDERSAHQARELSIRSVGDGRTKLTGMLTEPVAQALSAALDPLSEPMPSTADGPDVRSAGQRRHDGFAEMLRRYQQSSTTPTRGGNGTEVVIRVTDTTLFAPPRARQTTSAEPRMHAGSWTAGIANPNAATISRAPAGAPDPTADVVGAADAVAGVSRVPASDVDPVANAVGEVDADPAANPAEATIPVTVASSAPAAEVDSVGGAVPAGDVVGAADAVAGVSPTPAVEAAEVDPVGDAVPAAYAVPAAGMASAAFDALPGIDTSPVRGPLTQSANGRGAARYLTDGTPMSRSALEEALCDSRITWIRFDSDGETFWANANPPRRFTGALRRALELRDGGCAFPGCDRPVGWTVGHHIIPWSQSGPTVLSNGVLLCGCHHRLVHHSDWSIAMGSDGLPIFYPPAAIDPDRVPRRHERWHPSSPDFPGS